MLQGVAPAVFGGRTQDNYDKRNNAKEIWKSFEEEIDLALAALTARTAPDSSSRASSSSTLRSPRPEEQTQLGAVVETKINPLVPARSATQTTTSSRNHKFSTIDSFFDEEWLQQKFQTEITKPLEEYDTNLQTEFFASQLSGLALAAADQHSPTTGGSRDATTSGARTSESSTSTALESTSRTSSTVLGGPPENYYTSNSSTPPGTPPTHQPELYYTKQLLKSTEIELYFLEKVKKKYLETLISFVKTGEIREKDEILDNSSFYTTYNVMKANLLAKRVSFLKFMREDAKGGRKTKKAEQEQLDQASSQQDADQDGASTSIAERTTEEVHVGSMTRKLVNQFLLEESSLLQDDKDHNGYKNLPGQNAQSIFPMLTFEHAAELFYEAVANLVVKYSVAQNACLEGAKINRRNCGAGEQDGSSSIPNMEVDENAEVLGPASAGAEY
ncbi:unnamed protein product [Amoebophrya sp. A120]|nr:unnamed protein product [Amoebophrya sp. A120]|eukprot:GSA120T00014607001.1